MERRPCKKCGGSIYYRMTKDYTIKRTCVNCGDLPYEQMATELGMDASETTGTSKKRPGMLIKAWRWFIGDRPKKCGCC